MAPNAVAGAKELVARAALSPLAEHLETERRQFIVNLFHDNGDEGLKAFFEKRLPGVPLTRRGVGGLQRKKQRKRPCPPTAPLPPPRSRPAAVSI